MVRQGGVKGAEQGGIIGVNAAEQGGIMGKGCVQSRVGVKESECSNGGIMHG